MRKSSQGERSNRRLLPRLHLLWLLLVLLAALVLFLEFMADVGGSADPLPWPPPSATPVPSPAAGTLHYQSTLTADGGIYSLASSSNTMSPLS